MLHLYILLVAVPVVLGNAIPKSHHRIDHSKPIDYVGMTFPIPYDLNTTKLVVRDEVEAQLDARQQGGVYTGQSCRLMNYPTATEGPVKDAINYLHGQGGRQFCANRGCTLISCSYGTGVALCADNGQHCNTATIFGDETNSNYRACWPQDPQCACGGVGSSNYGCCYTYAMQRFYSYHNILIKGGYNC